MADTAATHTLPRPRTANSIFIRSSAWSDSHSVMNTHGIRRRLLVMLRHQDAMILQDPVVMVLQDPVVRADDLSRNHDHLGTIVIGLAQCAWYILIVDRIANEWFESLLVFNAVDVRL